MIRGTTLLATTALVVWVSTASAGQKADRPGDRVVPRFMKLGVPARVVHGYPVTMTFGGRKAVPRAGGVRPEYRNAIFDNINWKDPNAEFISWYGFVIASSSYSYYQSEYYHYKLQLKEYDGLPFVGTGKKAKQIGIAAEPGLNAAIYSATASGMLGTELASGAASRCEHSGICWANVDTFLDAGKKYFLVVECAPGATNCAGSWEFEDTDFSGAALDYRFARIYQSYNFSGSTQILSQSSPWHVSDVYPVQGAAIIIK